MKKFYLIFSFCMLVNLPVRAQCTLKLDDITLDTATSTCNHLFFKYTYSGGTPTSYQWTYGDGNSCNCFKPKNVYNKNGAFQVCGKITDMNGCSDSMCITVNVNCSDPCDLSEIGIFSYDSLSYSCDEIEFNTITSANAKTIKWDFGDGNSSSSKFTVHKYTQNGTYNVRLSIQDSLGCGDTADLTVNINCPPPKPPCNFNITKIDTSTGASCKTKNFVLTANKNLIAAFWTYGDGNTSNGLKTGSRTYADTGLYKVCVIGIDSLNCRDTFCTWVKVSCKNISSVNSPDDGIFSLYPNPVGNVLFISSEFESSYCIYDVMMKKICDGNIIPGTNILPMDFARGTYIIRFENASGIHYYRVVKE